MARGLVLGLGAAFVLTGCTRQYLDTIVLAPRPRAPVQHVVIHHGRLPDDHPPVRAHALLVTRGDRVGAASTRPDVDNTQLVRLEREAKQMGCDVLVVRRRMLVYGARWPRGSGYFTRDVMHEATCFVLESPEASEAP